VDAWDRYWFPVTPTVNLACCRIVAVAAQLFWFPAPLAIHINLVLKNTEFIDPQVMMQAIGLLVPREVLFTPSGMTAVYWATIIAGTTALIGFFTRSSLFIFALGIWFFVSHKYSYADVHHPEALMAIFLMTLAFAPSGRSLSLDALLRRRRDRAAGRPTNDRELSDMAMWPLKLAHVLLAATYFSTGATKLLSGGLGWMNGYTVQMYTFTDAMTQNRPLGIWLAQHHTLGILLGAFTVLFELFFFLSLLAPRLAPLFFLGGIFFHLGLYLASGQPFYFHIILNALLLLFLDPHWFEQQINKLRHRITAGRTPGRELGIRRPADLL
jgi:Vitamin K-dependent gamma-carboxylase